MAIIIKSKDEREKMRESGHIVAEILAELRAAVRPGITTDDIDALAVAALKERGAKSSSLGYRQGAYRYPASLCTSVNDEIVHGIPGKRELQEGDIISVDLAASYNGWHADSAITVHGGHGVGRSMHEDPQGVLNYVEPGYPNPVLKPGMVIAIEPMVNMGAKETRVLSDNWTVATADGSYSTHFEHTVAITEGDADILTL